MNSSRWPWPASTDPAADALPAKVEEAAAVLTQLASVFLSSPDRGRPHRPATAPPGEDHPPGAARQPILDAHFRAFVEKLPAVLFMAYLDKGVGEAYVSPQIEATIGFSQREWLEDPVRWYHRIHPDDKLRWSAEAAELLVSGTALRSAYRVIARDGRVIWFHCQASMIRHDDGSPWCIQGVAFDISDLKRAEGALQEERNVVSAILDTVGALVVVLDPAGRIVRFNRASERASGFSFEAVKGRCLWDLSTLPEEHARLQSAVEQWASGAGQAEFDSHWVSESGDRRTIAWSGTVLRGPRGEAESIIVTGLDVTERRRLERALLEISGREQRRIGQDLHDGLGQHLTGTAFMSKALQQRLDERALAEAADAGKIVRLVNEAIEKTRELSRGLLPVVSDADGLMSALQRWAGEVEDLFGIRCQFTCPVPVLVDDVAAATHLFHIAQEAVANAIKHGGSRAIAIRLTAGTGSGRLTVEDDGVGIGDVAPNHPGMGLHIMGYRARMIGGALEVLARPGGGTSASCVFPLKVSR